MAEIIICRPLCELDALTTEQCMTNQAYLQQDGMFMKLSMARTIAQHVWINYNKLGKNAYHVKNLPEIFYSKSRARLSHVMALHNCKQLQEWINYNYRYKTSLLNISKICMNLSVASSLHGNKITADKDLEKSKILRGLLCMLVLVTTEITKIHALYHWKRWHGILQNTSRAHAQKMHRINDTKMTNLQVLIRTRE